MTWYRQDPDARRSYRIDWELDEGDTITASTWTSTLTTSGASFTPSSTLVFVSGGTAGGRYELTNRITTAAGAIDDHTLHIMVEHT